MVEMLIPELCLNLALMYCTAWLHLHLCCRGYISGTWEQNWNQVGDGYVHHASSPSLGILYDAHQELGIGDRRLENQRLVPGPKSLTHWVITQIGKKLRKVQECHSLCSYWLLVTHCLPWKGNGMALCNVDFFGENNYTKLWSMIGLSVWMF